MSEKVIVWGSYPRHIRTGQTGLDSQNRILLRNSRDSHMHAHTHHIHTLELKDLKCSDRCTGTRAAKKCKSRKPFRPPWMWWHGPVSNTVPKFWETLQLENPLPQGRRAQKESANAWHPSHLPVNTRSAQAGELGMGGKSSRAVVYSVLS